MIFVLILLFLTTLPLHTHTSSDEPTTDLIVYSFDRPLQLYSFLESAYEYITGLKKITVIYRASNDQYADAYAHVETTFPHTTYYKQGENPRNDFKPLTLRALTSTSSTYVLFAVDDIVVTDSIDCNECIKYLLQTNAYGFYLRLGTQLTECYTMNCKQAVPQLEHVAHDIYKWRLCTGACDWGYPNTVDMTLYKKSDIMSLFQTMHYSTPNSLESNWSCHTHNVRNRFGLCYAYSKIVNLPLNRVQHEFNNRHQTEMSPQQLLETFNENLKMDIKPLFQMRNPGAHMEYTPTFISR